MIKKEELDFSAFIGKANEVIIKELTVVDITTGSAQHWIFKPPKDIPNYWNGTCTIDRHNNWLSEHYHGIGLWEGFSDYKDLLPALNVICSDMNLLYAYDLEKARFLEKLFDARRLVFSLEAFGCPLLEKPPLLPNFAFLNCEDTDEHEGGLDHRDDNVDKLSKQCLYHHMRSPGFVYTLDSATRPAKWCKENIALLDIHDPLVRENTFTDWKQALPTARELAESGFVRVHSTLDGTKCVYCSVVLCKWKEGDNPAEDHDYNSPYCQLIRFNMQLQRDLLAKEDKTAKSKGKQAEDGENEFYLRYANTPDITESDLIKLCRA